jgi:hypothetical protein
MMVVNKMQWLGTVKYLALVEKNRSQSLHEDSGRQMQDPGIQTLLSRQS